MKAASPALAALINSGVFVPFDVYTITLSGGGQLRFTTADFDIGTVTVGDRFAVTDVFADADVFKAPPFNGWSSKGVRVDSANSRALAHWKIGLDVDQWQVAILPRARDDLTGAAFPDMIGSVPWLAAAAQGALDAADVLIQRAYFPAPPTHPIPPSGAIPTGFLTIFRGQIAEVDVTTSMAILTVNDYRQALTSDMPRNFYQAACRHRLFDAGCGLVASTYARNGVVGSNSTRATIIAAMPVPAGSRTYTFGRVMMTSGLNATFTRTISIWDGGQAFALMSPFPFTLALGDTFTMYPGCDKQMSTCAAFGNLLNFGGDPFVPIPETTTGNPASAVTYSSSSK